MYLRGIQYSEMESIMQFIYLGEATFYEERMNEFIAVAKSLEIKELCNAESETNDVPEDDGPSESSNEMMDEHENEETVTSDHLAKQPLKEKREVVNVNGKYECKPCHKTYSSYQSLYHHNNSKHEGVKYACNRCDYQATQQSHLTAHIKSQHEGVRYACDQCDYQATTQSHLTAHIKSKHEGVRYACDQCDYQASTQSHLNIHLKSKHEGVRYACDQCDYQATQQSNLTRHIKSIH